MICTVCGTDVGDAALCHNCGNVVAQELRADVAISDTAPTPSDDRPRGNASGAALVLVLVGLVLSLLFVTCIPGLVCSIVGLVANVRSNRAGKDNPRSTLVSALGVVGIVVGVAMTALLLFASSLVVQVAQTARDNGWDLDDIEVVLDDDGTFVVRAKDAAADAADGTGRTGDGGEPVGVQESASSEGPSASSAASSGGAPSSGSAASAGAAPAFDPACLDAAGNPSLYAVFELGGKDLQALLQSSGYGWYDEATSWVSKQGSLFAVVNPAGDRMSKADIDALPAGGAGSPVAYVFSAEGYGTPAEALDGLAANVSVEAKHEKDGVTFALARGASSVEYLLVVTSSADREQTVVAYTDEAVAQGLFADTMGVDVGRTLSEAWETIAEG